MHLRGDHARGRERRSSSSLEEGVAVGRSRTSSPCSRWRDVRAGGASGWTVRPVTEPVRMRGSSGRWAPIATAESWNGGTAACNAFGFRFERVSVSYGGGGSWRPFVPGHRFLDGANVLRDLASAPAAVGGLRTHPRERGRRAVRVRRSVELADDLDRRPERDAVAQELDVAVVEPNAAVRDRLPEEVRPRRSVHADDPAARPVRELRVRARLERVGAEDRPVGVDRGVELVGDVEEPERRLRARCADGDSSRADEPRAVPDTRTCALRGR